LTSYIPLSKWFTHPAHSVLTEFTPSNRCYLYEFLLTPQSDSMHSLHRSIISESEPQIGQKFKLSHLKYILHVYPLQWQPYRNFTTVFGTRKLNLQSYKLINCTKSSYILKTTDGRDEHTDHIASD